MATTEVIAAGTAAGTADHSIPSGTTYNYACYGLSRNERVEILGADLAGNYHTMSYRLENGRTETATLDATRSTCSITGPCDVRVSKSVTAGSVGVLYYS